MRITVQLIVLMFSAAMLFTGCDQQMGKPVTDIIQPSKSSFEMAQKAMKKVNQRRTEAHQKAETAGDFSTVFTDSEKGSCKVCVRLFSRSQWS